MTSTSLKDRLIRSTLLAGFAAVSVAGIGVAQDADDAERFVVTGSRIAKNEFTSPAPITVVDQAEIAESGVTSIDELLRDLPSFTGFQLGTTTNNGNNGVKAVDLRGLGLNRNLVLVNGRRTVVSFLGGSGDIGAVDLNTIPLSMIERVEVLNDGASTIYGSDALAGVVNLILKTGFDGIEVSADYGAATEGWEAVNKGLSVVVGNTSDTGYITMAAEYSKQEEMLQSARDWATFDVYPQYDAASGAFIPIRGGSSNSRRIRFSVPGVATQFIVDETTGVVRPYNPATDAYNYAAVNALITPNERYQLAALGEQELMADTALGDISAFMETTYTRRFSQQRLAPDASFAVSPSIATPNNGLQWNDFVPASNPGNPFGDNPNNPYGISGQDVRINRRFEESGGRLFTQSVDTFRILAGLKGELDNGIVWDASYIYAENEDTSETRNYGRFDRWAIMVDPAACGADPACVTATGGLGYLDPFGPFGTIPQSAFDYLFAGSLKDVYRNELSTVQLNVAGDFGDAFVLPGGEVGWAVGFERREENASFIPDEFSASGLTTGGASDPLSGGFSVKEFYGELALPLYDNFNVSASARYSDYNTVGDTTNYRIGADFEPVDNLLLRASYSTGFRAPNVVELFSGDSTGFPIAEDFCEFIDLRNDISDTVRANCITVLTPVYDDGDNVLTTAERDALGLHELGFAWQSAYTNLAPTSLKPEESKTFTVGAAFQPAMLPDWQFSVDYWNIEISDYISAIPFNDLQYACLDSVGLAGPACAFFTNGIRELGGFVPGDATAPIGNLGKINTNGIDWNVDYGTDVSLLGGFITGVNGSVSGTYVMERSETFPVIGNRERAGTITGFAGYPELRVNTGLGVSGDRWSLEWQSRYISEMDDALRPASITDDGVAEAIWYHDLISSVSFKEGQYGLTLGINNLFDETPPGFHSAFNAETEPGIYDTFGRRIYARLSAKF